MNFLCETDDLEPLWRVLLTSDGTMTDMLRALTRERINIRKLSQTLGPAMRHNHLLDLPSGEIAMARKVLLEGDRSRKAYVYADSFIAINRLDMRFQHGLLNSDAPIGRIWRDNRIEIFKEVLVVTRNPAAELPVRFGSDTDVFVRTSRVWMRGEAVMLITEYFSPALPEIAGQNDSRLCMAS